jgi:hypothetical protein
MTPEKQDDHRDIKAGIAASVAAMLPHEERVEAVQGLLRVDEIEARLLISHGRRLARRATPFNADTGKGKLSDRRAPETGRGRS